MAKDTEKNKYLNAAIPHANAGLIAFIEQEHKLIGTAESQILVRLATERYLQLQGMMAVPTMAATTTPFVPINPSGVRETTEIGAAALAIPTVSGGVRDEELDDYGDPD